MFTFVELCSVTRKEFTNVTDRYSKAEQLHRDYVNVRVILYSVTVSFPFASKSLNTAYRNQEKGKCGQYIVQSNALNLEIKY
jgi:hypothetical protein